jgi:uncharacterized protein (DUF2249 family)
MINNNLMITPQTKVGKLLDAYPELEEVLIAIVPVFSKLNNPLLRKTVAKVTSLAQAARVGGVSVAELIGQLRSKVGQPDFESIKEDDISQKYHDSPSWFSEDKVAGTLDARPMIDAGEHPVEKVLRDLSRLEIGMIYELITPFEPAPLIDKAKARGFSAWVNARTASEFHTFFVRN